VGLFLGTPSPAQTLPSPDYREATVVVFNAGVPASRRLAETYAKARRIPAANLVGLPLSSNETITRAEFTRTLADPLRKVFTDKGWWTMGSGPDGPQATANTRRVLAVMSGVPLRISEDVAAAPPGSPAAPPSPTPTGGQQTDAASVDSELTLLGAPGVAAAGVINNPYFRKDEAFATGAPPAVMLVGRVDGPSFPICERMIADAVAVEKSGLWGRVYLDLAMKGAGYEEGDKWLLEAGRTFGTSGWPVMIDAHPQTLPTNYPMTDAAVYLGWYIRSPDGPFLNPAFRFRRGAVATHIHSFSATSIRGQTNEWCGPLLAKGAAAALGNTWEPFLGLTTHLNLFSERLLKGYTLAEAAWMSTPALSWMNVVLGDPLYRPFANRNTTPPVRENQEFQSYQALLSRHGQSDDHEALLRAVEAAASRRNSGVLWEGLGVLVQTYASSDLKRAAVAFEKAAKAYPRVPDKIRCYLQVPDMQRRSNQLEGAIVDLKRIISEYPKEPEAEAARMWLNTLQPPPAPPPNPPPASGRSRRKP
jgi:uncharacterized protein (TIGR03790 family)